MSNTITAARARRVIRLHRLPAYLGVQRSQVDELVKRGLLHPFSIIGKRAKVVLEDEVAELQAEAMAAAKAKSGVESGGDKALVTKLKGF